MRKNRKIKANDTRQNIILEKKLLTPQKIFAVVFLISILLIGISFSILTVQDARRLDVAYYGLPEHVSDALGQTLQHIDTHTYYPNGVRETMLTVDDMQNEKRVARSYDVLFMWNGAQANHIADNAQNISADIYNAFPSAIRQVGENGKVLPVLLDHYEVACLHDAQQQNVPENFAMFEMYLDALKETVAFPLFCAGSDDEVMLAFIGAIVESLAGNSGYTALVEEINKAQSFDACLDTRLSEINNQEITLRTILAVVVSWQKSGIIHQSWTAAVWEDALAFMRDKVVGVVFMSLSQHRTVPLRTIQNYTITRFPPSANVQNHALIAPSVVLITFSNNEQFRNNVALSFVSEQLQEYLSNLTQLAPTASRGSAFDRQADDVRYWAASCASGPVAALGNAAFALTEQQASFAKDVRNYLRTQ
ncbi:MAG: hypothetical protein J6I73_04770 [Treponema sp.]|nr:hypothetical protein [Treponema sp.]